MDRTRITVIYRGRSENIVWYPGTTAFEIESAIRRAFSLPSVASAGAGRLVLREAGGDLCVLSEHIPSGKTLFLTLEDVSYPAASSTSFSASTSTYSPARASPLRETLASPGLASPSRSWAGSSPASSPRRSPYTTSAGLSSSMLGVSSINNSSMSNNMPESRESLAKQTLRDVEKLQKFIARIDDLRREKKDEYFEFSPSAGGVWLWKRPVTSADFMSAVSSDLYFQAGSCGLLSSTRRTDTERVLNLALAAYMDHVRELGRHGNFDPITSVDAGYAREALDAAYDTAISVTRDVVREKLAAADRYSSAGI